MTVASKFVKITSPFSKGDIVASSPGVVRRKSERIMDCPARVISSVGAWGHTATAIPKTTATLLAAIASRFHLNPGFLFILSSPLCRTRIVPLTTERKFLLAPTGAHGQERKRE